MLKIEQIGIDSTKIYYAESAGQGGFVPPPPGPIIHQDYTNGRITQQR